jgi:Cupin-like domain
MLQSGQIRRVHAPSLEAFEREIFAAQRPVVLTGLFDGEPIDRVRTLDDVLRELGTLPLTISQEYSHDDYASQRGAAFIEDKQMPLSDYVAMALAQPGVPLLCVEQKTPEAVSRLYRLPRLVDLQKGDGDDLASFFFFGNPGNCSSFHFDGDFRSVLLHQVAGTKLAALVPPEQSAKMQAIKNFSLWQFHKMSEAERLGFLAFAGGAMTELHPGDTLFIPTGWWHHLEYVDFAMSFNIRLRRSRMLQLLGSGKLHVNCKALAVATRMIFPGPAEEAAFARIAAALEDPSLADPSAKFEAIEALYGEIGGKRPGVVANFLQTPEIDLWRERLDAGKLYRA